MNRSFTSPLLLLLGAGFSLTPAWTHPLGNFSISHYARFDVTARSVQVTYALDFAEVPTLKLIEEWKGLSQERADFAMQEWIRRLEFRSQGQPVSALHEGTTLTLGQGNGGMQVARVAATLRLPVGTRSLEYEDRNFPGRIGWKEIVIAGIGLVEASHPDKDLSQALTRYPLDSRLEPPRDLRACFTWRLPGDAAFTAGSPAVIRRVEQPKTPNVDLSGAGESGLLADLLGQGELPLPLLLAALGLAFGMGAAHALEPGHGKTIAAAYLVGSRGTWRHAVWLGGITTFTHTFSVFCLGVATLAASRFVAPEIIIPVLSVGSGLTVIGLGLWLFKKRWDKLWSARRTHLKKDLKPDPAKQSAAHHHHHHHDPPAPGKVTFGGLLALGVSGGIVPCPAALVLLLGAIAAGRAAFGLGLLAAFSLGLSAVLIAVGLAVLYAKELVPAHVARDESWTHYVPVFSALVITFSGLFLTAWAIRSLL